MTDTKPTRFFCTAISAVFLCAAAAHAGVDISGEIPVIRGERAPTPPLSVNTGSGEPEQPFAFADFPDLPGYIPPLPDDKGPEVESVGNPFGSGVIRFGDVKVLPDPDSGQSFDGLPRWDADRPLGPSRSVPPLLPDGLMGGVNRGSAVQGTIPAPGTALFILAGAALARRRR